MKITKTINSLLEKVDTSDVTPWEMGCKPIFEWAIKEELPLPAPKLCLFCGQEVSLTWEVNKDVLVQNPDKNLQESKWYGYGMTPTVYRVARDIHPKCKKLKLQLNEWGVTEKRAFETDYFNVCNENKNAFASVNSWIEKHSPIGLYLYGNSGTGKTLLATKIILESSYLDKLIISESDLFERLTPNMQDATKQNKINNFLDEIKYKSLLIIDDLGTCKKTDWKMETLFSVISKRIDRGLSTFFTSNFTPVDLYDRLDSKIVSRVFELTNPCHVGGIDNRINRTNIS